MKPHIFTALLALVSASHGASVSAAVGATADETAAAAAPAPAAAPAAATERAPEKAAAAPQAAPALPEDMRVVLQTRGPGPLVTVVRKGHLVALVQGKTRKIGSGEIAMPIDPSQPIYWETYERETLAALRGKVDLDVRPDAHDRAKLVPLAELAPAAEDRSERHACKAFELPSAGFSVVCRVNSSFATAARAFGDAATDRVSRAEADSNVIFRMDLDPGADGVDAILLGYTVGSVGHVVRAEAISLPGEAHPTITLLSADRAQLVPPPRTHHHFPHRHPEPFMFD